MTREKDKKLYSENNIVGYYNLGSNVCGAVFHFGHI